MKNHNSPVQFTIDLLKFQRNFLALAALVLLLISLLLAITIASSSNKVVIIPTLSPQKSMIYDPKHISEEYYTEFSLDILHLLLDIDPNTVLAQYQRLQMHFLPSNRQSLNIVLRDIKQNVLAKKLTTFFIPDLEMVRINKTKQEVLISGVLKTLTYNTVTAKEEKLYRISYKFFKNRLYINSISEVIKDNEK